MLCLLTTGWLSAQQQGPRFSTSANLVLVDVRVLDKQGKPVRGLTADDFTILEDGIVQKTGYFREISLPLSLIERGSRPNVAAPSVVSPTEAPPPATPSARQDDKRLLVFLFDLSGASLQDVQIMQETGRKFVEEQLTPLDSAAVLVLDNGLEMLSDFTSDPAVLTQAFRRLGSGEPEQDVSQTEEGTEGDSEFVADQTELALFQTNQQLSAVQSIADAFRDVTGRKALVYFSTGITSRGIENDEQMRWTVDTCNRANMSVYSIDARGLMAMSPGGGAHRAGGRGAGIFTGGASLDQLSSAIESQNGLVTLAAETGGAALLDDNDLSKLVRQAQEDGSHYYMLGYYVPNPAHDGRFRRIEVRTRNKYATVVARKGYYAEKPYISLTSSERELKLLKTVVEDLPASELPLEISAEYFPEASQEEYEVLPLLSLDYEQLKEISGADALALEIVILARDASGRAAAGVRDKLEIKSRREEKEARFVYENLFVLPPGQYQLFAYVRENRTGKMSRSVCSLDLPATGPIRSSSLVLAGAWRAPDNPEGYRIKSGNVETILKNPLMVGSRALIPRVDGRFRPGETLYIHGTVRFPGNTSGLEYRVIVLGDNDKRLFEGNWQQLNVSSDNTASINARLPLAQLKAGKYTVGAEVRGSGGEVTRLTRQFAIAG